MNQPTLPMLVWAEVFKLQTRLSFRLALVVLGVLAFVVPFGFLSVQMALGASPEAAQAGVELPSFEATTVLNTVLGFRNFFLARALLITVVAVSVAGEFVARTLREDLVRPVSRVQVLTAKLLAIQVYVAASVLVPLVLSAVLSFAIFGVTGPYVDSLIRWGLAWVCDAGFATLVVAIAVAVRSVPGTIVGVFVYWIADRVLGLALWGVESARPMLDSMLRAWGAEDAAPIVDMAILARPWLPSAAFNLDWDYDAAAGLVAWQSVASLVLLTLLAYTAAVLLLARVDID
jgi:ABC-type transport system involved in multi-copper enzyme maturation permease subunit